MERTLLALALLSCTAASAQLHNGGFEDLNSNELPAFWQGNLVLLPIWIDPIGGMHTDSVVFDGGANYLLNTTDVHSGQHAIELRNGYDFTTQRPFIGAWSAAPDSDAYNGFPLVQVPTTDVPVEVAFYAKYLPVDGDSAEVTVNVFNEAGEGIGGGTLTIVGTHSAYTLFTVPITYVLQVAPLSMQLTFANARAGGQASLGTRFLIDDVSVATVQGITERAAAPAMVLFPNPAEGTFTLRGDAPVTGLRAIDAGGRERPLQRSPDGTVACSALAPGAYVLRIATPQGEVRKVLMVERGR